MAISGCNIQMIYLRCLSLSLLLQLAYLEHDAETILFAVKDGVARAGLPPKNIQDNFHDRATIVGKLNKISTLAFNRDGELFAVRGAELYRGPMPSDANVDWRSAVKCVGKSDWDKVKHLRFAPSGHLYAITKTGVLYKGPAPSNENVPWFYDEATKVGTDDWMKYDALFFDLKGIMYAVKDGKLVMGSPPTKADENWLSTSTAVGNGEWRLAHFMDIGPNGELWCVDYHNGNMYKGSIPTKDDPNYIATAENLGSGYNDYSLLSLTTDKTIQSVESFEFLPDSGKIVSQSTEVVYSQIYKNKSRAPLKLPDSFSRSLTETSFFSQDHGFLVPAGTDFTFKAGSPVMADPKGKISIDQDTSQTWSFTKKNYPQKIFSSNINVEVPSGHAIRIAASVTRGEMDVPYRMVTHTPFGHQATLNGTWRGVTYSNLMVTQEDYTD